MSNSERIEMAEGIDLRGDSADEMLKRMFEDTFKNTLTPDRFGDILFIGSSKLKVASVASFAIQGFQAVVQRRPVPAGFSHVAICIKPGLWMDARPGVGVSILESFEVWRLMKDNKSYRVKIFRPTIERDVFIKALKASLFAFEVYKNPYNYLVLLNKSENIFSKRFYRERYFCSEFAVSFLKHAGLFPQIVANRTLPADLYWLCENSKWESIENNEWYTILENQNFQEYIFLSGENDQLILQARTQYLESCNGLPIYSTLNTLHYMYKVNLMLKASVDASFRVRMATELAEIFSIELIEKNKSSIEDK